MTTLLRLAPARGTAFRARILTRSARRFASRENPGAIFGHRLFRQLLTLCLLSLACLYLVSPRLIGGGAPAIATFSPAEGCPGMAVTVIGSGFTGATGVIFGSMPALCYTVDADDTITAVVPRGAGSGPITVKTPDGAVASADSFTVVAGGHGRIVFVSSRDGNYEIYRMNADGTVPTRLTSTVYSETTPAISPDGRWIAFATGQTGANQLYLMDADGAGKTRLTNSAANDYLPAFSPDGRQLAFASSRDGNWEIYLLNLAGGSETRLTSNAATDSAPAFTADGRQIVFNSDRDGNYNIYRMNLDGSGQTALTTDAADDLYPGCSPDGTKIAFDSARDGNWNVYAMNADGSAQHPLTVHAGNDMFTAFSPDGKMLAFSSTRDNGNYNIGIMNVDGSAQRSITALFCENIFPHWGGGPPLLPTVTGMSPAHGHPGTAVTLTGRNLGGVSAVSFNGTAARCFTSDSDTQLTTVVPWGAASGPLSLTNLDGTLATADSFTVDAPDAGRIVFATNRDGNAEIYLMKADGTRQTRLTTLGSADLMPALSPDGRKVAFISDRNGSYDVYTMNSDGTGVTRLTTTPGTEYTPVFSPDSRRIAYVSFVSGTPEIYLMNADGSGQTRLTTTSVINLSPTFSPDGKRIAFSTNRDGNYEIYTMNTDGSGLLRLAGSSNNETDPVYSPDGTKIACTTTRNGTQDICLMNVDGSSQTIVGATAADEWNPCYSPDGARLAFLTDRNGNADIYTMTIGGIAQTRLTTHTATESDPNWGCTAMPLPAPASCAPGTGHTGTTVVVAGSELAYVTRVEFDGTPAVFSLYSDSQLIAWVPAGAAAGPIRLQNAAGVTDVPGSFTVEPPGRGRIVFRSTRDGNSDIYLMNADGTGVRRLTDDPASDYQPEISRDGTTVVFVSERYGNPEICKMNADGSGVTRLTVNGAGDYAPTFSPNGQKIAFSSLRDGDEELYLMNADGSGQARLTFYPGTDATPAFSPDGKWIVFSSSRVGLTAIYRIPADGSSGITPLTPASGNFDPSYSYDGSRIVFRSARDGTIELYAMNADGSGQTRLTDNADTEGAPAFSPDGTQIVFDACPGGYYDLYLMNADGTHRVQLTTEAAMDTEASWGGWSNTPPIANADAYATDEDAPLAVDAPGLLGNDTDAEGQPLTVIGLSTPPQHGTATLAADGGFRYEPAEDYHGQDTLTYKMRDEAGSTAAAIVSLTVRPVADPPDPANETLRTSLGVVKRGVLHATDPDGDIAFRYALVDQGTRGTVAIIDADTGEYTYTPRAGAAPGADRFTFRVTDPGGNAAVGTITVDLQPRLAALALTTDRPSPQPGGTAILLTALATGGGEVEYAFKITDAASGAEMLPQTPYTFANIIGWVWPGVGTFELTAFARERNGGLPRAISRIFTFTDGRLTRLALAAVPPSPQLAGTPVTVTALAQGSAAAFEYRFRVVNRLTGAVSAETDFAAANTLAWTEATEGNYIVTAFARDETHAYELQATLQYALTLPAVTDVSLAADLDSPQPAGTAVTFTAAAAGPGPAVYKFAVYDGTGVLVDQVNYTASPTYRLADARPAGVYSVTVLARPAGRAIYYVSTAKSFVLTAPDLTGLTLAADRPTPQVAGTPVTFIAAATGSGPVLYRFVVSTGGLVVEQADYSPNAAYTLPPARPAGAYTVTVYARRPGLAPYTLAAARSFVLTDPTLRGVALAADRPSPQRAGTAVRFTAAIVGGGTPRYRFIVRDAANALVRQRDYAATATYDWDATLPAGNYRVTVTAYVEEYPDYTLSAVMSYVFTAEAFSRLQLATNLPYPQPAGTAVRFTPAATGGGAISCRFVVRDATGAVVRETADAVLPGYYDWDVALPAGQYAVYAYAHLVGGDYLLGASACYVFTDPALTGVTLAPDLPSPQPAGTRILAAAIAAGSGPVEYRFAVRDAAGGVTLLRDYTPEPTAPWSTAGWPAGAYTLLVYARPEATRAYVLTARAAFVLE